MRKIDKGFAPIIGELPRVLILGSMPSIKSLEGVEYYAHPQNAFWWIMAALFNFDLKEPYTNKVEYIKQKKLAVWDVIAACHRPGSLDSAIDANTVKANNFSTLLNANTSIKLVVFNGQAAQKIFKKHVQLTQDKGAISSVSEFNGDYVVMPSTSPANAATSREMKLKHWKALTAYL